MSYKKLATTAAALGFCLESGRQDNHPHDGQTPFRWALFDAANRERYASDDCRYDRGVGVQTLAEVESYLARLRRANHARG